MKGTKRKPEQKAYKQGYQQGIKGHSQENCPYRNNEVRGQWLGGWRQGHADYVAGFRGDESTMH